MANFGRPTFGLTKNLKQMVIYEVPNNPGHVYQFRKNRQAREHSNWTCVGCEQFVKRNRGASVAKIQISNEPDQWILTSPMNPNPAHSCAGPTSKSTVSAKQVVQEARKTIRTTGKKPLAAYIWSEAEITKRHADDHLVRADVEREFGENHSFKKIRSSLYRHLNHKIPVIPTLQQIPRNLKMTLEGANSMDINV